VTGDVHQAHFGLDHDVVSGAAGEGARLAVARDASIDDTGVEGGNGSVVEGVLLQGSGEVVLNENVAFAGEAVQDVDAGGGLEG
jgi:hypothetical protein